VTHRPHNIFLIQIACIWFPAVLLAGCTGKGAQPSAGQNPQGDAANPGSPLVIPEPPSWSFPEIVESARSISPHSVEGRPFNQNGLSYPVNEIMELPVASMSAEDLLKYADVVTHAYPDAVFRELGISCDDVPLGSLNGGSLANLAYVAKYAIDRDAREQASTCLAVLQERMRKRDTETEADFNDLSWHKSDSGLDLIFVATDDFDGFLEEWESTPYGGAPSAHAAHNVRRGDALGLLLMFAPLVDPGDSFDPFVSFTILRPDSTVYGETPLTPAWSGGALMPGNVYLCDTFLRVEVELSDPLGEYSVIATFKKNNTSEPVILERSYVVEE